MSTTQFTPLVLANADTAAQAVAVPAQAAAPQTVATVDAGKGKGGFSAKPTVGEIVEFQVTGLLVVFVVLGAITALSILMSWLLKVLVPSQYYGKTKPAAAAAPAPAAKAAPAAAPAATASGLSHDKLLVILAAAAQEVLGKSVAVVSYSVADSSWAMQGRVAHHHSHKL
jgi:hypothetical protein